MVVLVGPSGSGKSTFAARHFLPTQVLSSDAMRAVVADDPDDQGATEAAFELLHTALALRLAAGRLTVIDATNVERWARGRLLALARRHGRPAVALVFETDLATCLARNRSRIGRARPPAAIRRQARLIGDSLAGMEAEGFVTVHHIDPHEVIEIEVAGTPD
jgi:protein phosphatase